MIDFAKNPTEQEVYDFVVGAIVKQGRASITQHGACVYRGPDGLKCAAGQLITDAEYSPQMEAKTIDHLAEAHFNFKAAVLDWAGSRYTTRMNILRQLQGAHDGASVNAAGQPVSPAEFLDTFRTEARNVAGRHKLDASAVDRAVPEVAL